MLSCMRTTLTLDPDVAKLLERLRAERDVPFRSIVNEALRLGLAQLENPTPPETAPYRTPSESLGGTRLPSVDDVAGVLALIEGEERR